MESHEHPAHARTGHRGLDIVLSSVAVVISLVSIFVAYHTSHSMERLVQANSWPFLQLGHGNAFGETAVIGEPSSAQIYFTVTNAGTGPAVIHNFEFRLDGQVFPADGGTIDKFLKACCVELLTGDAKAGGNESTPIADTVLAPGSNETVLRWPLRPENDKLWHALDRVRQQNRIAMSACYCSVFDECWVADTSTFPPRKVTSCETEATGKSPAG